MKFDLMKDSSMGTQNVGCILTGLEIREGDLAYLVVMSNTPIPYEGYWINTPPLLGIFDGGKAIELTEHAPCLDLRKGDIWPRGAYDNNELSIVFVHPEVFDALGDIVMNDYIGDTFGAVVQKNIDELRFDMTDRGAVSKILGKMGGAPGDMADAILRNERNIGLSIH